MTNSHFQLLRNTPFGARLALTWLLVLLLALPMARTAHASSSEPPTAAEVQDLERLVSLGKEIQDLNDKPAMADALKAKRQEANILVAEMTADLETKTKPLDDEITPLKKKVEDGSASESEQKRYAELMEQKLPFMMRESYLKQLIGESGLEIPLEVGNARRGSLSMPGASTHDVMMDMPEQIKARRQSWAAAGYHGAMSFTHQYFIFSVAMGVIALGQLQFADASNPNALGNWEKQTFDLLGMEGFAAFMMANHGVIKMYQKIKAGAIPGSFINYLGMTAGSLASTVFHDLASDKDLWKCIRPYYDANAKPVAGACERMRATWLLHNKILQYGPSVASMLASTALSQAVRSALVRSGAPQAANDKFVKVVMKGVRVVNKSRMAERAAEIATGGAAGFVVAVGDFIVFLAIDAEVTQPYIDKAWQDMRSNVVDPKPWLDKNWNLHSEFLWPKEGSFQPIANAFDVEATSPYTAHNYLMEFFRRMQANGWKKPAPIESCVPERIAKDAAKNKDEKLDRQWFWNRFLTQSARKKTNSQLMCEVFARPADLIERYGETNKQWRDVILGPFNSAQYNWLGMINQFSTVYQASYKLTNHLATAKFNNTQKGAPRPDLSREALAKVISSPLPSSDTNADSPERVHSWFLEGTWIPTPELIDYVSAGFACGPDPVLTPDATNGYITYRAMDQVYSFFAKKITSPSYMSTPYGSSLHFTPPKLTSRTRAICENVPRDLYSTVNYITGNHLPQIGSTPAVQNPFTGPFKDENGQSYPSLIDFAYDNMDNEVFAPIGNYSGVDTWWSKHFAKVIEPVWANYSKVHDRFTKDNYIPVLFDRSFRYGCRDSEEDTARTSHFKAANDGMTPASAAPNSSQSETACTDSSGAYRVANGVFLALETELRNYLRGLFSLYSASLPPAELKQRKAEFMQIANAMIEDVKAVNADELRSKEFEAQTDLAQEKLNTLISLVETALGKSGKADADSEFRAQMLGKFKEQISKLFEEELQYAKTFHTLDLNGSPVSRASGKNLNSPISINPLQRH